MVDSYLNVFKDPELKDSQILRRYLDLPKFVDFLRTSELFLAQASRFEDRLEGTLPEKIRRMARNSPEFVEQHGDPTNWETENRNRSYISCWTHGEKDNMALWKLYGRTNESVAITTTVGRLSDFLANWSDHGKVDVKKVQYINHAGHLPDGVYGFDERVFGFKHTAYAFEKEIRIVISHVTADEHGNMPNAIRVPVKFDSFLRSIVVAPEAGDWFFDLVRDIARKYNVATPVRKSVLTRLLANTNGSK